MGADLPIDVLYTTYYGYILEPVCLTLEQAEELALVRLRESMDVLLSESELVNKSVRTYYDDEYFYLDCSVYCIEDIAQLQEIFVLE